MAVSAKVNVSYDAARLARLEGVFDGKAITNVAGRAVSNEVRAHLEKYNTENPNKLGGPRTNFYNRAADSIQNYPGTNTYVIAIHLLGFRLQLLGGTVRAGVNPSRAGTGATKYLAIPAVPEAHGKLPSEWSTPLEPRIRRINGIARAVGLEEATGSLIAKARDGVPERPLIFRFTQQVTVRPHPDLLPTQAAMDAAAGKAIDRLIRIAEARANEGNHE